MEYQLFLLATIGLAFAGQRFVRNPVVQHWVRVVFFLLLVLAGLSFLRVGVYLGG